MALTCNGFTAQTVSETSQDACCVAECLGQERLLPNEFLFLLIDGLSRKAGIDISTIDRDDLVTVVNNAKCSLEGRTEWCTATEQKLEAIALYLLNELLCEGDV